MRRFLDLVNKVGGGVNQASKGNAEQSLLHVITALLSVAGACAGGGLWIGRTLAVSNSRTEIATYQGQVAELKQKVELAQSREDLAIQAGRQLKSAYDNLQVVLSQQSKKISDLASQLGKERNCDFVHQQILATQQEISASENAGYWTSDRNWQQEQKIEQDVLEKRLATYQQQLGSCNR